MNSDSPTKHDVHHNESKLAAKPRKASTRKLYFSNKKAHSCIVKSQAIESTYEHLYVTRTTNLCSGDRLKQIVKEAQKRRSSKFNWNALNDIHPPLFERSF